MREEGSGLLPHDRNQLVEIVGCRRASARRNLHRVRRIGEQAVLRIVDELVLVLLLHLLDENAELLLDLIEWPAIEVRHAGLDVEYRGDRAQEIFARRFVVVDEGLRQILVPVPRRARLDDIGRDGGRAARLLHAVETKDAGLDRRPWQERNKPAWGNSRPLRPSLCGIR